MEKIQEVKTTLEKLKVKTEQHKQKIATPTKEGVPLGKIV